MPDSPAFRHKKMYDGGKRNTLQLSMWRHTPQVHSAGIYQNVGPLLLNLLYDTDKSLENAGRPECGEKIGPASAFLPIVNFVSPASVFRHLDNHSTQKSEIKAKNGRFLFHILLLQR
jgi:hypothetical protein